MIDGPQNGIFLNPQHVIAWTWHENEFCRKIAVPDKDETANKFFMYGVNHISDHALLNLGPNYVVLNDLSDAPTEDVVRIGFWPIRLRVYGDSAASCQRAREQLIKSLPSSALTEVCSICRWFFRGRSLVEVSNGYRAQVTLRPHVRG